MSDVSNFYAQAEQIVAQGKFPHVIESGEGAYLTINGKKKLNFCSSHYLGLAVDKRLESAISLAVKKYGIGTGYRTLAGTHKLHVELENALATFKHAQAAIVLSSGYMANCAAIQTIIGKEDIVISDELNHASIIDAVRLSQVKNKYIYKHRDMQELENCLKQAKQMQNQVKTDGTRPVILIITDGVFSMDGDLAPIPEIVRLAKKYDVLTMVDDAHGEGVLGNGGRGVVDHFGLSGQIDIEVGSLSKAFSVLGGYITGKKVLIDLYKLKARQFLFSIALTIPDTAAVLKAVSLLQKSDTLVKKLWSNVSYLRSEFNKLGFDTGQSESPITPVMLGDEQLARTMSTQLFEKGVFATPIVFPMVAKGKARIRVIPSASHSKKDLDFGVKMFAEVGRELGVIK